MARIVHGQLAAATVATQTLSGDAQSVEIVNRDGTAEIYFLVDSGATNPVVEGVDCDVLVASMNAITKRSRASGATTVKMISAGTPKYTIRVVDDE